MTPHQDTSAEHDLVANMRALEADHEPDGWPAVRMKEISALCDEIERLRAALASRDEAAQQPQGQPKRPDNFEFSMDFLGEPEASTLRTYIERLEQQQAGAVDEVSDELVSVGGQLANVAFNWAQRAGHVLTGDDVAMLDKLRKQWDAAIRYAGGCPIDFRPTAKEIAGIVLEEAAKVCEFQAERFTQGSPLEGNKPYAAHECAAAIRALAEGVR